MAFATVKNYNQGYATGNVCLSIPKELVLKQKGKHALVRIQLHKCDLATPQILDFGLSQGHVKRLTSQIVHCQSDKYALDLYDILVLRHAPGAHETRLVRNDLTREFAAKSTLEVAFEKSERGIPVFNCFGAKRISEPPYECPGIRRFPRFNPKLDENGGT